MHEQLITVIAKNSDSKSWVLCEWWNVAMTGAMQGCRACKTGSMTAVCCSV